MYSKCVQPKLLLVDQIVKLVGKWPMANYYFVLCILPQSMGSKYLRAWGLRSKTWGLSDLDLYLRTSQSNSRILKLESKVRMYVRTLVCVGIIIKSSIVHAYVHTYRHIT